ncbi:MAG: transglycosylase domain-containing protein, partial [Vagococcus sp.]|nr:transglycosylase domain-containing protein [Vagococcus sp.]
KVFLWVRGIFVTLFSLILIGVIAASLLFLIAYWKLEIPSPSKVARAQITKVYYADGKTEMGTFAERNRKIIQLDDLPNHVSDAVIASEDRTFWENNGVDFKGIARALWNNIQGKPIQGASTLSQQYIENYYVGDTRSYTGKFKETILALKINREQSKEEILINYLNTIYFGRGAYGIEAAAQAYFNKSAKDLSVNESALLSGIIPAPSVYDPKINKTESKKRWQRVIKLMVEDGYISQDEADKFKFPKTIKPKTISSSFKGTKGYLLQHVRSELRDKAGYTDEDIDTLGLKIVTTIQPQKQKMIEEAVNILPESKPKGLRVGAVSIDPRNGEILAEYGGADYLKIQSSAATQDIAQAGSTMKIFALAAALEKGINLDQKFPAGPSIKIGQHTVWNYGKVGFGERNLIDATRYSINTVYVKLNQIVGPSVTRQAAVRAGIPEDAMGFNDNIVNVLGSASVHTVNIAEAYGTFANDGVHVDSHIVKNVTDLDGRVLYKSDTEGLRVFQKNIARKVNVATQATFTQSGSGSRAIMNRPQAGKTGSSENNKSAQFVGYIPQMVTAVSLYQVGDKGEELSITPFGGFHEITGSTWPTLIYKAYVSKAFQGLKIEKFKEPSDDSKKKDAKYKIPSYSEAPPWPTAPTEIHELRVSAEPEEPDNPEETEEPEEPADDEVERPSPSQPPETE